MDRIWLDVPYAEKDAAKALGARWDPRERRWWAPPARVAALTRWLPVPPRELPETLPGEDRSYGEGLYVDLVPHSCWFTNARSCIDRRDWQRVRELVLGRADHRCEVCGRGPDRLAGRRLEVHERWAYDELRGIQSLRRLICLCSDCHLATHYGYARVSGREEQAFTHLAWVRREAGEEIARHVEKAMRLGLIRSQRDWKLDLSILTDAGIRLAPPPEASQRRHVAATTLGVSVSSLGHTPGRNV